MYYRISAKTNLPGIGVTIAWYSGRKTGRPRFEAEATHDEVLRYYFFENAKDDKAFLDKLPQLCQDVEIVAQCGGIGHIQSLCSGGSGSL